jgi:SP family facilitated glucose transporter-like MFS transporter 8
MLLGAVISTLLGSVLVKFGKWKMIIIMNILVIIGYGITMYDNMYVIAAGRFVLGFGAGGFSVYCPKFIAELSPNELRGTLGAVN